MSGGLSGETIISPPAMGQEMDLLIFKAFFATFVCIEEPVFSFQDEGMLLSLPGNIRSLRFGKPLDACVSLIGDPNRYG